MLRPELIGRLVEMLRELANDANVGGCGTMSVITSLEFFRAISAEEAMVLAALNRSAAKRFVDDPASTLLGLDHQTMRDRANYLMRDWKKDRPK